MLLEHMLTIWLTISCLISGIVSLDNPNSKCISQMAQECTTDQECIDACASERLGEGKCGKFRASTFLCYCNGCEQINTLVFPSEKKSSNLSTTNQHLCGGTNYDPTVSVCLKGKTICSIGELACRNATTATCYDPSEKTCFAGLLCPNNQTFCGDSCIDPSLKVCIHSEHCPNGLDIPCSCTRGSIICAGYCYDPTKSVCYPNNASSTGYIVCPLGQILCGNDCYDPVEKTCIKSSLSSTGYIYCLAGQVCIKSNRSASGYFSCPVGNLLCGSECYDPAEKLCIKTSRSKSGYYYCPLGNVLCGDECMDLSERMCFGELSCSNGKLPCGSSSCFDPREYVCYRGKEFCADVGEDSCTCRLGTVPCGTDCIKTNTTTCFTTAQCGINGNTKPCSCPNGQLPYDDGCKYPKGP